MSAAAQEADVAGAPGAALQKSMKRAALNYVNRLEIDDPAVRRHVARAYIAGATQYLDLQRWLRPTANADELASRPTR
jgi:hypothetical protein